MYGGNSVCMFMSTFCTNFVGFQEHAREPPVESSHGCEDSQTRDDTSIVGKSRNDRSLASILSRKKVSSIALSVTGVMTQEKSAAELSSKGATLIESSVSVLRQLVQDMKKKVFLVCDVEDDIGEAVVLDCLDHAGLIGDHMIPRHRVIFCSCSNSKVSIIRQLEPSLYVDGNVEVCRELGRFMDSILLLQENTTLEEILSSS